MAFGYMDVVEEYDPWLHRSSMPHWPSCTRAWYVPDGDSNYISVVLVVSDSVLLVGKNVLLTAAVMMLILLSDRWDVFPVHAAV